MLENREKEVRIVLLLEPAIPPEAYSNKYYPLITKYIPPLETQLTVVGSQSGIPILNRLGLTTKGIFIGPRSYNFFSLLIGYLLYLIVSFFTLLRITTKTTPHLLLSLGGHTYSGLVVTLVSKFTKIPAIIRIAGPTSETVRTRYILGAILSSVTNIIEGIVFRYATGIFSNSASFESTIGQFGKTLEVIPQGVDTSLFSPCIRRSPDNTVQVITVCRLSQEKRISNLIKAISYLQIIHECVHLTIVGNGPEREHLKSLTKELGLTDKVIFIGNASQRMVAKYLQQSDIFILPSLQESLPSALLEAMASKIPTITVSAWIDSLPFIDRIHTLVCDGSPEGIAECITNLIKSETLREEISENALKLINQSFSINTSRTEFRRYYRKIYAAKE